MKEILGRANNYLKQLSTVKFVIIIVVSTFLIYIPFIPIFYFYEQYIGEMGGSQVILNGPILTKFFIASILAPLVETTIFQALIIEILNRIKILKEKKIIIVIISALMFGISHTYSYIYIFYAFIMGVLLAYSYLVYKNKSFPAFWVVFWIHSIRNTISVILIVLT